MSTTKTGPIGSTPRCWGPSQDLRPLRPQGALAEHGRPEESDGVRLVLHVADTPARAFQRPAASRPVLDQSNAEFILTAGHCDLGSACEPSNSPPGPSQQKMTVRSDSVKDA